MEEKAGLSCTTCPTGRKIMKNQIPRIRACAEDSVACGEDSEAGGETTARTTTTARTRARTRARATTEENTAQLCA